MTFSQRLVAMRNARCMGRKGPLQAVPTLPIIGRRYAEWNVFSIFIFSEIFFATRWKMTYSWS
jgi:hypothetical protein